MGTEDKARAIFSRLVSGEVLGQVVNESGTVVFTKSFGIMSEDEYRGILRLMEQAYPDIGSARSIEITGN